MQNLRAPSAPVQDMACRGAYACFKSVGVCFMRDYDCVKVPKILFGTMLGLLSKENPGVALKILEEIEKANKRANRLKGGERE